MILSGLTEVCIVEKIPRQDGRVVYVSVDDGSVKTGPPRGVCVSR